MGKKVFHGLDRLKSIDYSGLELIDCSAKGCNFSGSLFQDVKIENCDFSNAVMMDCQFKEVEISKSTFNDTLLTRSSLEDVKIKDSNFNYADFCGSNFSGRSQIKKSHFDACSFIEAVKEQNCQMTVTNTTLNDCVFSSDTSLFADTTKTQSIPPRPVIGLLWEPHKPGHTANKAYERIKENNGIPVRVSYLSDGEINLGKDGEGLDGEVKRALNDYTMKSAARDSSIVNKSRAMHIMRAGKNEQENPEIAKIRNRAKRYGAHLDGFIIPGGADIPSDLYGKVSHPKASPENNYMRSIMEFAVIEDQKMRGNPLMGICRGCQIFNVYQGGNLIQRLDDKGNYQSIDNVKAISSKHGIIPQIMDEGIRVMSVHHQAVEQVGDVLDPGDALEVVAINNGVVKAVENKHGAPVILTQFHPEVYGEHFADVFNSHKGSFINKFGSAAISLGVQQLMHDNKNYDFIATMVQMASVKRKHKMDLMQSVEQLSSSVPFEEDIDNTPLFKPSTLKKSSQSDKPEYVAWLNSLYRQENKQNEKNKANSMFSLYFTDKTKRNERALFEALNSLAKKIRELESDTKKHGANHADEIARLESKIDSNIKKFTKNHPESITSKIVHKKKSEKFTAFEKNRLRKLDPIKAVTDYAKKNPDSYINQALVLYIEQTGKDPFTVEDMMDAFDLYEQHHNQPSEMASNFISALGEIHNKFYEDGAQLLDKALTGFYPKELLTYVQMHHGELPVSQDEWQLFKAGLKQPISYSLIDLITQMDEHIDYYKGQFNAQINQFCHAYPDDPFTVFLNERQPNAEMNLIDKQKLISFLKEYRNARKIKNISEAEALILLDMQNKKDLQLLTEQMPTTSVSTALGNQQSNTTEEKTRTALFTVRSAPSATKHKESSFVSPSATIGIFPRSKENKINPKEATQKNHLHTFFNNEEVQRKHDIKSIETSAENTTSYALEMNLSDLPNPFKLVVEDITETEQEHAYLIKADLSGDDLEKNEKIKKICSLSVDMALPDQELDLSQTPSDIKPMVEKYLKKFIEQAINEGKFTKDTAPKITGLEEVKQRIGGKNRSV